MADEPKISDRHGVPRPGDEQHGDWSRDRLEQMDQKFRKRVEQSMRDGTEHMPGGTVK
jgi:hypothetical protein